MVKVFISHNHDEKDLALAWKDLIAKATSGVVNPWLSSDQQPSGGMPLGEDWRNAIYARLAEATHVLAIVSPRSQSRPWILWECGVATGINKERKLVPIVHSMPLGDLSGPMSSYQAYDGDNREAVQQVCARLAQDAGLAPTPELWPLLLAGFDEKVKTSRPKRPISASLLDLWLSRFDRFIDGHRYDELPRFVDQFYVSVGERRPLDSRIHDRLSEALLGAKKLDAALAEVDFALALSPDDSILLHRKGLILAELGNYHDVQQLLGEVYGRRPQMREWPELAGLEGRMYRDLAGATSDPALYRKAGDAYRRVFEADPTQHYPGGQAVVMALLAGDEATIDGLLPKVIETCKSAAEKSKESYWVDFTLGEMYLVKRDVTAAVGAYKRGIGREPAPSPRDRESALKGARRTAGRRALDIGSIEQILSA